MVKLRFRLNKNLDKKMAAEFINIRAGGIDFGKNIIREHPYLKDARSGLTKEKIIDNYFDTYYKDHESEIKRKIEIVEKRWFKLEKKYISTTEKYFGGFKFPKGKYIAYPSIIDCNPRFLDLKTFQFFYKKTALDIINTVAHELLHFIFFDFVQKKLPETRKRLSENELWKLSEIFNVVLLKSLLYKNIVDLRCVRPYPNHRKYLAGATLMFRKSKSVKEFIKKITVVIGSKK